MARDRETIWVFGVLISPFWIAMAGIYALILIGVIFEWLDRLQPPVVGWLFYPVNRLINAVFFPNATQPVPVYGNGTAIFMFVGTGLFVYVPYRILRGSIAIVGACARACARLWS